MGQYKKFTFEQLNNEYNRLSASARVKYNELFELSKKNNQDIKKAESLLDIINQISKEQSEINSYLSQSAEKLKKISNIDGLTGVLNRKGLEDAVTNMIEQYQEKKNIEEENRTKKLPEGYILFYFDLDGLKDINDGKGHKEGDKYILAFVNSIKKYFRDNDILARDGGDEFVGIIGNGIDKEKFNQRLEKIKNEIELNKDYSVSYGSKKINFYNIKDLNEFNALKHSADEEMYRHKESKK